MKKILFAGSEATPFVSTGGLGDVMGSLPAALASRFPGLSVSVVLPLYSSIPERYRSGMKPLDSFEVPLAWRRQRCDALYTDAGGVRYIFIGNSYYFDRPSTYGQYDDGERFAFFGAAVVELMKRDGMCPDILHANDWQSATAVIYLDREKRAGNLTGVKSVFTVHNLEYQGKYDPYILGDVFGLGEEYLPELKFGDCINLLKGAAVACDRLTTVSPTYASEILTPEFGCGLEGFLGSCRGKLRGILNGIDTGLYDPGRDPDPGRRFGPVRQAGKDRCRAALCSELGISGDGPLFSMITRLAGHKGIGLAAGMIDGLLDATGGSFVLLGTGEREYEDFFRGLEGRHPGRVRSLISYDRGLASRIYAGADIFIMPSLAEPCGLAQMIASRYGTVPVVRRTGGLADSIKQAGIEAEGSGSEKEKIYGNGFVFDEPSPDALFRAAYAAAEFISDPVRKRKLRGAVMSVDFSWEKSAGEYMKLYEELF